MKPLFQKYLHTNHQHGDCWRTCISSILEVDVETFPYHNGDISWADEYSEMVEILEKMGWYYVSLPITNIAINRLDSPDTDGYIIAVGKSPRGDFNHSVVWKNGLASDPHYSEDGIESIIRFEMLVKIKSEQ